MSSVSPALVFSLIAVSLITICFIINCVICCCVVKRKNAQNAQRRSRGDADNGNTNSAYNGGEETNMPVFIVGDMDSSAIMPTAQGANPFKLPAYEDVGKLPSYEEATRQSAVTGPSNPAGTACASGLSVAEAAGIHSVQRSETDR